MDERFVIFMVSSNLNFYGLEKAHISLDTSAIVADKKEIVIDQKKTKSKITVCILH